jgi:restriction endonuclease S subunit
LRREGLVKLGPLLIEVKKGVGPEWTKYRLVGVTRSGIGQPKDPIGKSPGRYKLVAPGTIVYNPMRILLGSIGVMTPNEEPGIISPDYVVFQTDSKALDPYYFFSWLKSTVGVEFIRNETRGAVRQRMKLKTLGQLDVSLPKICDQKDFGDRLLCSLEGLKSLELEVEEQLREIEALRTRIFDSLPVQV